MTPCQITDIPFSQMLHNTLEENVLTTKVQSRLRSNTFDRLKVVAAEQDTQVNDSELRHLHIWSFKGKLQINFTDRLFLRFREGEMSVKN